MTVRDRPPAPRLSGDGGSVVIEAAIVLPLILVFLSGIVDFGVGFRDRTIVQSALRNGARAGAAAVESTSADQLALSTMYVGLKDATRMTVVKAIIYEANGLTDGKPTSSCLGIAPQSTGAGSASGNCNVYGLSQVQAAAAVPSTFVGATTFTSGSQTRSNCTNGWNRYWCAGGPGQTTPPNERTANLTGTVDSFGLYVEASYEPLTGVFSDGDFTITDWVVMRMEPAPG